MEPPRPHEYTLDVFADPSCVKEVVKAILHTIFFHRYFITIVPITRDLLDQTLPAIDDVNLETLIDQQVASLMHVIETPTGSTGRSGSRNSGRAQIAVNFFEKKRRKSYFFGKADEEICWEIWKLNVTCATPRTDSEARKVREAMQSTLQKTALKVIKIVNEEKDHIPPITTTEMNPFPYTIVVNPRASSTQRVGIF
jgi:autophagy-related protein 101